MFARIANILGWAGVALVFAALAIRIAGLSDYFRVSQGLAYGGLGCILVYVLSQWRDIAETVSRRQARYGTLSLVSVLTVLGILLGLNYVASRQNKRWDLTSSKEFELSEQTRKILQDLKQPLKLIVFERDERAQPFRDRLGEYTYLSKQVQVEFIDPLKQPSLAKQYQIQSYGTIAIEYQGRVERVTGTSEQDLTNGIIKAVVGQQKKIYFVAGHNEHDTGSADERVGYNAAGAELQRENYTVEKITLAQRPEIPTDAAVVVIAGPAFDYLQPEIDALKKYLNKGGHVLFMLDPPDRTDSPPLTNLAALAREWGIEVHDNVIVDQSSIGQLLGRGPGSPVVGSYPGHAITERFNVITSFPLARSVTPVTGGSRTAQSIAETSQESWAESDVKALAERRPVSFDEGGADKRGPVSLAAAISTDAPEQPAAPAPAATPGAPPANPPKRETRVVVFGDSDFASNSGIGIAPGNRDLFLNTINWLAQQENLIAIRPKAPDDRRVTLTDDQLRMVMIVTIVILPGLVIAAGVLSWWRRRG
jgi:ABC-type uncharacterized transport system involved in gliding motility auxiliary subunit